MALELQAGTANAIRRHGAETTPTSAAVRSSVATASSLTYTRCRIRLKKGRGDGFVRPQDYRAAERQAAQAGAELLGFTIRIRIIPPGRRTIRITLGRIFAHHRFGPRRRS